MEGDMKKWGFYTDISLYVKMRQDTAVVIMEDE